MKTILCAATSLLMLSSIAKAQNSICIEGARIEIAPNSRARLHGSTLVRLGSLRTSPTSLGRKGNGEATVNGGTRTTEWEISDLSVDGRTSETTLTVSILMNEFETSTAREEIALSIPLESTNSAIQAQHSHTIFNWDDGDTVRTTQLQALTFAAPTACNRPLSKEVAVKGLGFLNGTQVELGTQSARASNRGLRALPTAARITILSMNAVDSEFGDATVELNGIVSSARWHKVSVRAADRQEPKLILDLYTHRPPNGERENFSLTFDYSSAPTGLPTLEKAAYESAKLIPSEPHRDLRQHSVPLQILSQAIGARR
jgi:hypothetical protein